MDHSDQDNSHTYAYKHNRYSSHNQIIDSVIPHSTVLDIGCGEGIISRHLHEKNCMVVGVDRKEPDPSFTRFMDDYFDQDIEESLTAISEKQFDYALAADVLEHVRDRTRLLQEIATSLKPGGLLIASTGNIALFIYRFSLLLGRFDYGERGILDKDHVPL